MTDLGPMDADKLRRFEAMSKEIGNFIGNAVGGKVNGKWKTGFALFIFSFGGPEFTYISNAQRDDMVKMLEEVIAELKKGGLSQTSQQRG